MRLRYANLAVILASPILSPAAQVTGVTTIAGTLQPELVPNSLVGQKESLKPASAQERGALPVQLGTTDRVFTGVTFFCKKDDVMLALSSPADGRPYLFADVNQNSSFEEGERFSFVGPKREVLLKLPPEHWSVSFLSYSVE